MKKRWVQILVSLLAGGGLKETMSILLGRDDNTYFIIGSVLCFLMISVTFYFINLIRFSRELKKGTKPENDSIIDNEQFQ